MFRLNLTSIGFLWGLVWLFSTSVQAAPEAELDPFWEKQMPGIMTIIDHGGYRRFLTRYVEEINGQTYVNYAKVDQTGRDLLDDYVTKLQRRDPRGGLGRDAQFAYWVNLYNAHTLQLILNDYPIKSITKLGGLFSFGPWNDEGLVVAEQEISLNDIEHRILRPIWKDPRIHYVVNCASLGCPNLPKEPLSPNQIDRQLTQAAEAFINHPRGVSFSQDGVLRLSSIYDWYQDDFLGSDPSRTKLRQVVDHLKVYAKGDLLEQLMAYDVRRGVIYQYDWGLNELKK